ncbi:MAG: sulfatase [Geminicoccaceae bacterium]|nr:sulfatase [Geminicoccaceae bacterium]
MTTRIGWARGLATALVLAVLGGASVAAQEARKEAKADRPPNIVFILSDDEDLGIHPYMPKVKALIEDEGVTFDNAFVTYSLCCPSRSTILRGQYPHNTGVLGNLPPEGGFKTFRLLKREGSTVATWLQGVGYRTAFYGKYLNGYTEKDAPPPGWDEWHAANNNGYFNVDYKLNSNGKVVAYGDAPEDYLTDVIAEKASAHIRRFSAEGRPFFLYVAPFNPHSPYNPAPRHKGMFKDADLPRPPAFDEADVSDKPGFIQGLPLLSEKDVDDITGHYRARLECLQAIDDLAERLVGTLKDVGQLDNTYVVYASDNGFHLGLHRMKEGKDTAYEEDIRVPFALRGPGVPKGGHVGAMVLNNDFAPTFAAMAGVTPPGFVDGRSLLPLLKDPAAPWRRSFLVQRLGLEADERLKPANALAVRTGRYALTSYNDGEHELYDLETDPHQLHSMEPMADPALVEALTEKITQLKVCRGEACREAEDAPVGE